MVVVPSAITASDGQVLHEVHGAVGAKVGLLVCAADGSSRSDRSPNDSHKPSLMSY
jgi:hypothetical protein